MRCSRRQFIGLVSALGLGACAQTRDMLGDARDAVSSISMPKLPRLGGNTGPFSFAALNDLHVTDARSTAIVNRASTSINAQADVAFTVGLGDLSDNAQLNALKLAQHALDRLEQPYFTVPGNHDLSRHGSDVYANYRRTFAHTQWREEDYGWVFIGLDTCQGTADEVSVPPERIEWLEGQLARIRNNRPIALFAHHPFNPNSAAFRVSNADEVLALFSGHNLKIVACGHYHGNQVEEQGGVLFTTTACCSTVADNHDQTSAKGYRLFHVAAGDEVTTEFVSLQE